jgi:hypothetical protein
MKHCVRLQKQFDVSAINGVNPVLHRKFSKRQCYNRDVGDEYTLIPTSIYSVPDNIGKALLENLPQEVLDVEVPQVFILKMEASSASLPVLGAHVDLNRSCGINIYLDANGETTHYYDWNLEKKCLTEVEQFVAEKGETWLMDTSVPHSVTLVPNKDRTMLTYSFVKTPYDVIKQALEMEAVSA